ncbi:uncharacterized protein BDR25DRAFT_299369 [Lindgomyces ingoldianus]|uniref:Uncharacterized protein n=1 Tax=Lindgomyces ingoldianus TaxID=673940 RepID=A0ACB6RDS7_9PLEO|nr:uncharacterized protein BDR25DRAFT_299369 [Lindgomyces ingoldianus]KAF2477414.1 hypothetical protein BDR25DRAFT_299369 [Lindgomyces ingoldianus]
MPNVLVLSFEGFSFSSRQLYQQLLPKLLSRASVHESLTIQDALNYILTGWPTVILVTDPVITSEDEDSQRLLLAVADLTKHGCTTILMGFFAAVVTDRLNVIFKEYFDLRWRVAEYTSQDTSLLTPDENLIRTSSLVPSFYPKALFLGRVPAAQTIYVGSSGNSMTAYAAYARVGLGKLGYVGDVNFGEEPERLILAMCHLDRPEDSLQTTEDMES